MPSYSVIRRLWARTKSACNHAPCHMKSAARQLRAIAGFTLVETLVVMVISVGLVILIALLYRTVGQAALSLKGGHPEWVMQNQLRNQLAHGLKPVGQPWIVGEERILTFLTWYGRIDRLDGRPVVAQYRFDPADRTLTYREVPLPAWWGPAQLPALVALAADLKAVAPVKLMGTVSSLDFSFLPADVVDFESAGRLDTWQRNGEPKLIVLRFTRSREYVMWLELSSAEAS